MFHCSCSIPLPGRYSFSIGHRMRFDCKITGPFWEAVLKKEKVQRTHWNARSERNYRIEVRNPYFLMEQTVRDEEDLSTKYVFVEQYQDQPLQLGEGQAMGWFSPDETYELKMIEHDRAIVERMRDYLNQL